MKVGNLLQPPEAKERQCKHQGNPFSGIFAHNARYFPHLWQPGRLWETRGFAPPLRRRFALEQRWHW
jgi:hypothetical protein